MIYFFKKYLQKTFFFYSSKKKYKPPNKKKIIIYDRSGSELFFNYLNINDVEVLDVRGESINVPILIRSLFHKKSNRNYKLCYIDQVDPKLIITFIDNNTDFYIIKNFYPNIITIFVQNGYRGIIGDVFDKLNIINCTNFKVDYMLCFGDAICKHYSKYIQGKSISIGSFKNNMINSYPQNIKSKTILYISQFREKNKKTNVFISSSSLQISTEEFFSTEFYLLPKLYTFCKINGFRLQICGCSNSQSNHEISYYNNVFHDSDWDYFSKENIFDSYKLIDIADYVVTIDSTLGYEAFARGKKVAFFTCRGNYLKIQGADFGWPLNIKKKGEFWTNEINDFEINRVLNFVTNVQSNIWESLKLKFMPGLINFDKQNQKFIKILIEEGFY